MANFFLFLFLKKTLFFLNTQDNRQLPWDIPHLVTKTTAHQLKEARE